MGSTMVEYVGSSIVGVALLVNDFFKLHKWGQSLAGAAMVVPPSAGIVNIDPLSNNGLEEVSKRRIDLGGNGDGEDEDTAWW